MTFYFYFQELPLGLITSCQWHSRVSFCHVPLILCLSFLKRVSYFVSRASSSCYINSFRNRIIISSPVVEQCWHDLFIGRCLVIGWFLRFFYICALPPCVVNTWRATSPTNSLNCLFHIKSHYLWTFFLTWHWHSFFFSYSPHFVIFPFLFFWSWIIKRQRTTIALETLVGWIYGKDRVFYSLMCCMVKCFKSWPS